VPSNPARSLSHDTFLSETTTLRGTRTNTSDSPYDKLPKKPCLEAKDSWNSLGLGQSHEITTDGNGGRGTDRRKGIAGWPWWWEIASISLSIICLIVLLILLLWSNGMSLAAWRLPIQPNSLISVLTTVSKTAMMVAIAGCLNQLKWRHFMTAADSMRSLQLFDDASRGPWGSAMLILKMRRRRVVLAWALALATIVGLGIEPSAQQILDFPQREALMQNATATLGRADDYYSMLHPRFPYDGEAAEEVDRVKLRTKIRSAILGGFSGARYQPAVNCPSGAASCTWDKVTTLGYCGEFRNVTDVTAVNCTTGSPTSVNCTYDFPGRNVEMDPLQLRFSQNLTTGESEEGDEEKSVSYSGPLFSSIGRFEVASDDAPERLDFRLYFTAVKVPQRNAVRLAVDQSSDNEGGGEGSLRPPGVEQYHSIWSLCRRTYFNVTASPGGNIESYVEGPSVPLVGDDEVNANTGFLFDIIGPLQLRVVNASFVLTYKPTSQPSTSNEDEELEIEEPQTYRVGAPMGMLYTNQLISTSVYADQGTISTAFSRSAGLSDFTLDDFMYGADLHDMTESLASMLTNLMQSAGTSSEGNSGVSGDNANATTTKPEEGRAYFREVYIHVRWGWLVLPMAETLLTAVLMGVVIYVSGSSSAGRGRGHGGSGLDGSYGSSYELGVNGSGEAGVDVEDSSSARVPLLKESVVAYLAAGLDEKAGAELRESLVLSSAQSGRGSLTGNNMTEAAKGVMVRLVSDRDGRLQFVKAD